MIGAGYHTAAALALLTTLGIAPSAAEPVLGPWYAQPPLEGTGPGLYYSYHPEDVPGYPQELRGYPVPVFPTGQGYNAGYEDGWSEHVSWCYDRWRSYRESDNSYQPLFGPRRECRSPYL